MKKFFNILFWIILIGLMVVWLIDFFHIKNEENPQFCLKTVEDVEVEHDGSKYVVSKCTGLGYKAYYSDSFHAFEPFYAKLEK